MARTRGRIISDSPTITIILGGSRSRQEFESVVDTGFTGFISLPIALAVPLGLEIDGLNAFTLADGSQHQWMTAAATVEFGSRTREVSIALAHSGTEVLLGMNFLQVFQLSLVIHRNQVWLIDEQDLDSGFPVENHAE